MLKDLGLQPLGLGKGFQASQAVLRGAATGQRMYTYQVGQRRGTAALEVDDVFLPTILLHHEGTEEAQWRGAVEGVARHAGEKVRGATGLFGELFLELRDQFVLPVNGIQIKENAAVEQCPRLGMFDPLAKIALPDMQRLSPLAIAGHDAALAIGITARRQAVAHQAGQFGKVLIMQGRVEAVIEYQGVPVGDVAGIPATLSPAERLYEPLSARGILRCTQTAEQDAVIDERVVAMLLQRILDHLALETMCGVNKHATIPLNVSFNVDANGAEQLASLVRMHFGIASAVAFDYVELLENNGLRVIFSQLPAPLESLSFFDAKNNNAFIVVSDAMTPERQLFKIMYELANIFLYTRTGNALVYDTDGTRHFAKRFAAVMLMPQTAVQTSVARAGILPEQWTFEMLLRMKARFGVSAEAFLYRLDELSLLPRDGALLESLSKAIKQHYLKTSFKEPAGEVSRMSRNVRFTDLLLCAKLTPENGKEVRKIESRVRKNYPLDESIPVVKASAKNVDKKRSGPVRPKRAK